MSSRTARKPTGLRYCMNGVSLDFHAGETAPPASAPARAEIGRAGAGKTRGTSSWSRCGSVGTPRPGRTENGSHRVLERNIRALDQRREQEEAKAGFQDRLASAVTRATGSMAFVYLHLLLFGVLDRCQSLARPRHLPPFDPSFTILAMAASVEAIFLSTFVLITQNRMAAAAEKRAELDLQISLLAEHEITKLATMVAAIAERIGIDAACRSRSRGDHAGRDPRGGARRDRGAGEA